MSAVPRHVVVVGGGITGSFAAAYLARRTGVTVIARDPVSAIASGNTAGALNPLHGRGIPGPLLELALAAYRLHLQQAEQLGLAAAQAPANRRLEVAGTDADAAALVESIPLHTAELGLSATWLDAPEARDLVPALNPGTAGGLLVSGSRRVDGREYLRRVQQYAASLGASFVTGEVSGLHVAGAGPVMVQTGARSQPCDAVLIATGPWCRGPAAWLGLDLPVESVQGELLRVAGRIGPPGLDISCGRFGAYPAAGGSVWLGGTEEPSGGRPAPTARGRAAILDLVRRVLPGVRVDGVLEHTAGLRPVTPDGLPICGLAPGVERVALALGGGRKGVLLAPALARAAVDLLLDGVTGIPVAACSPQRPGLAA